MRLLYMYIYTGTPLLLNISIFCQFFNKYWSIQKINKNFKNKKVHFVSKKKKSDSIHYFGSSNFCYNTSINN